MSSYTYVLSDIHGQYDAFIKMLEKIKFSDDDILYVDGDVLDRGPEPIKTLLYIMKCKNIKMLAGNHEYMASLCLDFLLKDIDEELIENISEHMLGLLSEWKMNGGSATMIELFGYDKETRNKVNEYIKKLKLYKTLKVNDKDFILVHGGLGHFSEKKKLNEYNIMDLVWERLDYDRQYFKDKYIITGHTPTQVIEGNPKPGYIYINKNNIAIDCGSSFNDRLACLRLDDFKEYYVEIK